MTQKTVKVGTIEIANSNPFVLIAGPCALESKDHAFEMCGALKQLTQQLGIPLIYKTSFDKANRTSLFGIRGLGMDKGLEVLADVRKTFGVPVLTDVHQPAQCKDVGLSLIHI